MSRPVFLFDLDGTLLDTDADLAAAVNAARAALGLPALGVDAVRPHIGWGLGHLLRGTLPAAQHARLSAAREHFHAHYRAHLLDHSRPFADADAVVAALGPARCGLVTNKPGAFVDALIERLGWRFGVVVAGDTLAARKPDAAPLRHAAEALGAEPSTVTYVGDSEVDLEAAAAAGTAFAAVAWGRVAPRAPRVVERFAELLDAEARPC
ncbi:MAG: HAD-IA family hydrolase [Myxococcales bacterium]|nr:HAD-IA family hydrolase [Myxococcales bacterium]